LILQSTDFCKML